MISCKGSISATGEEIILIIRLTGGLQGVCYGGNNINLSQINKKLLQFGKSRI